MHAKVTLPAVVAALGLLVVPVAAPASHGGWQRALAIRSDALNKKYHLGKYAVPRALTARTTSTWYRALELRSRALNDRYGLGDSAPTATGRAFDWSAAAIGAAVATGICVLLAAAAMSRARIVPRAQRMS
jgi:hypothetical protein